MAIANYMLSFTDLDRIWFIVSPHNPLKDKKTLLADHHRLAMVQIATEDEPLMEAKDIEFKMPQPSYTIDTLSYLSDTYPQHEFVVLMGGDSLTHLPKWKNYKQLIEHYAVYVYARPNHPNINNLHPNIKVFHAPQMEISASFIRQAIQEGKNIRHFLPPKVWDYLTEMHFYGAKF